MVVGRGVARRVQSKGSLKEKVNQEEGFEHHIRPGTWGLRELQERCL